MYACDISAVSIVTAHLQHVSRVADGNLLWLHYTSHFLPIGKLLYCVHERV